MDRNLQVYGSMHRYEDYYHDISGIRDWLRSWARLANKDTLTEYVRIALGHLVLDEMWSKDKDRTIDELLKSAYRSYAQKGFGSAFFKE